MRVNDFETVRAAVERDEPLSLPRHDDDARAALDRIEAEVERLRAALEQIANEDHGEHPWSWQECFEDIQKTARIALSGEKV